MRFSGLGLHKRAKKRPMRETEVQIGNFGVNLALANRVIDIVQHSECNFDAEHGKREIQV
jgi:hypothetical protein